MRRTASQDRGDGAAGAVVTIHINSITGNPSVYFIPGHRYLHHNSSLHALPGAQPAPNFADAYQGAMEEAAIWKKRALEAEDLNRKFIAEINGPTHMGEPAQPTPSVPEGWLRAIDEALVTHLGVANESDTYEQAREKLND